MSLWIFGGATLTVKEDGKLEAPNILMVCLLRVISYDAASTVVPLPSSLWPRAYVLQRALLALGPEGCSLTLGFSVGQPPCPLHPQSQRVRRVTAVAPTRGIPEAHQAETKDQKTSELESEDLGMNLFLPT